jgi:hypothetical protein
MVAADRAVYSAKGQIDAHDTVPFLAPRSLDVAERQNPPRRLSFWMAQTVALVR